MVTARCVVSDALLSRQVIQGWLFLSSLLLLFLFTYIYLK